VALPDPDVPLQGRRFVIVAAIVGVIFTVLMAVLTYAFAVGWSVLHHQPNPVPTPGSSSTYQQDTNEKSPAS